MRKLISLTRLDLINSLIERADMFLYTISNCAAPLITLFVWLSFTPPGESSVYTHNELIWYFLLVMLVKLITSAWGGQFLSPRIRRGAISPFLTQPTPYIYHYISNNIAEKIIKLVMLLPLLCVLIITFRVSFLPVSLSGLVASIASLVMAAMLFFLADTAIGLLGFWFEETSAVGEAYGLMSSLFSGMLIPLIALPQSIRNLGYFLPFRYTLSLPIEIFLGQLSGWQIYISLAVQLIWLLAVGGLCRYLWTRGLKVYSASGA